MPPNIHNSRIHQTPRLKKSKHIRPAPKKKIMPPQRKALEVVIEEDESLSSSGSWSRLELDSMLEEELSASVSRLSTPLTSSPVTHPPTNQPGGRLIDHQRVPTQPLHKEYARGDNANISTLSLRRSKQPRSVTSSAAVEKRQKGSTKATHTPRRKKLSSSSTKDKERAITSREVVEAGRKGIRKGRSVTPSTSNKSSGVSRTRDTAKRIQQVAQDIRATDVARTTKQDGPHERRRRTLTAVSPSPTTAATTPKTNIVPPTSIPGDKSSPRCRSQIPRVSTKFPQRSDSRPTFGRDRGSQNVFATSSSPPKLLAKQRTSNSNSTNQHKQRNSQSADTTTTMTKIPRRKTRIPTRSDSGMMDHASSTSSLTNVCQQVSQPIAAVTSTINGKLATDQISTTDNGIATNINEDSDRNSNIPRRSPCGGLASASKTNKNNEVPNQANCRTSDLPRLSIAAKENTRVDHIQAASCAEALSSRQSKMKSRTNDNRNSNGEPKESSAEKRVQGRRPTARTYLPAVEPRDALDKAIGLPEVNLKPRTSMFSPDEIDSVPESFTRSSEEVESVLDSILSGFYSEALAEKDEHNMLPSHRSNNISAEMLPDSDYVRTLPVNPAHSSSRVASTKQILKDVDAQREPTQINERGELTRPQDTAIAESQCSNGILQSGSGSLQTSPLLNQTLNERCQSDAHQSLFEDNVRRRGNHDEAVTLSPAGRQNQHVGDGHPVGGRQNDHSGVRDSDKPSMPSLGFMGLNATLTSNIAKPSKETEQIHASIRHVSHCNPASTSKQLRQGTVPPIREGGDTLLMSSNGASQRRADPATRASQQAVSPTNEGLPWTLRYQEDSTMPAPEGVDPHRVSSTSGQSAASDFNTGETVLYSLKEPTRAAISVSLDSDAAWQKPILRPNKLNPSVRENSSPEAHGDTIGRGSNLAGDVRDHNLHAHYTPLAGAVHPSKTAMRGDSAVSSNPVVKARKQKCASQGNQTHVDNQKSVYRDSVEPPNSGTRCLIGNRLTSSVASNLPGKLYKRKVVQPCGDDGNSVSSLRRPSKSTLFQEDERPDENLRQPQTKVVPTQSGVGSGGTGGGSVNGGPLFATRVICVGLVDPEYFDTGKEDLLTVTDALSWRRREHKSATTNQK